MESRLARCAHGWWLWSRVPRHLQAVCTVHLLTGISILVVSFYAGPELGGLFLCLSCLAVLALCRCTSGASCVGVYKEKPSPEDLEADNRCAQDLAAGLQGAPLEVAVAGLSAQTGQLQATATGGDLSNPKLQAALGSADSYPQASASGSLQRERSQTLPQAADALPVPCEGHCSQWPAGCLIVPEDATLLDGLRNLVAHHLKRAEVFELSVSQAELLEHHLDRLASYSEKIVHTISFSHRVFIEAQDVELRAKQALQEDRKESSRPEEELAPPRKPQKKLRLDDEELLQIYSEAQQEAELEADWRGIHFSARGRKGLPPLVLSTGPGLEPFYCATAAPPEDDTVSARAVPQSGRRQERHAAIGLLGQALANGEGATNLTAASEDLASRLMPLRQPRHCNAVVERTDVTACCLPMNDDRSRSIQGGLPVIQEPFFRVPQEREGARESDEQSLGVFGSTLGRGERVVLAKESTDISQSSGPTTGMVQAMPVLSAT